MRRPDNSILPSDKCLNSRVHGRGKVALVTPCVPHLPFNPSWFLGYAAAALGEKHNVDIIDLNAELYLNNRRKLKSILDAMDKTRIVSDSLHL